MLNRGAPGNEEMVFPTTEPAYYPCQATPNWLPTHLHHPDTGPLRIDMAMGKRRKLHEIGDALQTEFWVCVSAIQSRSTPGEGAFSKIASPSSKPALP